MRNLRKSRKKTLNIEISDMIEYRVSYKLFMKKLILISLLVILSVALPSCKEVYYDHMTLALTWPEQFCSENRCDRNWRNFWDKKSFNIHGMWPASSDLSYISCQIKYGYDKYCYRSYNFDLSKFSASQRRQLDKYWAEYGPINHLWSYQWKKHGTCFLHIIKDEEKSTLSDTQIFKKYFMETINKVKELNIQLSRQKVSSKKKLADLLGLHESQFHAICRDDKQLDEIRICYDIYYEPGKEYLTKCPSSTDRNICKYPMYIK